MDKISQIQATSSRGYFSRTKLKIIDTNIQNQVLVTKFLRVCRKYQMVIQKLNLDVGIKAFWLTKSYCI